MLSLRNEGILFGTDGPLSFASEQVMKRYVELPHVHVRLSIEHVYYQLLIGQIVDVVLVQPHRISVKGGIHHKLVYRIHILLVVAEVGLLDELHILELAKMLVEEIHDVVSSEGRYIEEFDYEIEQPRQGYGSTSDIADVNEVDAEATGLSIPLVFAGVHFYLFCFFGRRGKPFLQTLIQCL